VKLSLTASAQSDIDDAAGFYARKRPMLGAEFIAEVDRVLAVLQAHPQLGYRMDDSYRRIPLRRFSYSLLYKLDYEKQLIRVSVVAHQHRRPGFWRGRVEEAAPLYIATRLAA
jgi:toxin ParE1/3/4